MPPKDEASYENGPVDPPADDPPPKSDAFPTSEERYSAHLQSLKGMGFENVAVNIRALEENGGELHRTIDSLLSGTQTSPTHTDKPSPKTAFSGGAEPNFPPASTLDTGSTANTSEVQSSEAEENAKKEYHRHRWEFGKGPEAFGLVSDDIAKYVCSIGLTAAGICWAIGLFTMYPLYAVIGGAIILIYLKCVFTGSMFKTLGMKFISKSEFLGKLNTMYSANASTGVQLRWKMQCYHIMVTTTYEEDAWGWQRVIKRKYKDVVTLETEYAFKHFLCDDFSHRVTDDNIKEDKLYRAFIRKCRMKRTPNNDLDVFESTQPGNEFVNSSPPPHLDHPLCKQGYDFVDRWANHDDRFKVGEYITLPGYQPTFLVASNLDSLPVLFFNRVWYVVCSLTIVLSIPYDLYFLYKAKIFPIDITKEFVTDPESSPTPN